MYKDYRYINAGENEIYRFGKKAQEKANACLIPNESGYYSIEVDGGKYWTIGTSNGKFGEFAKINDTIFSVNSWGYMYAKADTEKGEKFVQAINNMINTMKQENASRCKENEEE